MVIISFSKKCKPGTRGRDLLAKKIFSLLLIFFILFLLPTFSFASISSKRSKAKEVRGEVATLSKELSKLAAEYNAAQTELEEVDYQMRVTQAKLEEAQRELERYQGILNRRVVAIYRHGNVGLLDVLFSSKDFQDLLVRLDYLTRIGKQDSQLLARAKQLKKEIEERKAQLARQREEKKAIRDRLASSKQELEQKLNRAKSLLASIEGEISRLEREERERVAYYYSSRSSGNYRIGSFVFPVRGSYAFSNDWGAPRRGHRHQGCDIFAPYGTPVVACVSGTVSHNSGGSAGLWISLHGDDGNVYYYMHLSGFAASGHVSAGEVIGYVGDSGNARGGSPHLHFEIHPGGGGPINPYPILARYG